MDKYQVEQSQLVKELFMSFLEEFSSQHSSGSTTTPSPDYMAQIEKMRREWSTSLYVDFGHIASYNAVLASVIARQFVTVEPALRKALEHLVRRHHPDYLMENNSRPKEFWVHLFAKQPVQSLRSIRCGHIGRLISFRATVTRSSDVRPELLTGSFYCLDCHTGLPPLEQAFGYAEPSQCANAACGNTSRWFLDVAKSRFVDWQHLRVQEHSRDISPGSTPRHLDVILRHELVDQVKAGYQCIFTGTLLAVPVSSGQMRGASDASAPVFRAATTTSEAAPVSTIERSSAATFAAASSKAASSRLCELTYHLVFIASFAGSAPKGGRVTESEVLERRVGGEQTASISPHKTTPPPMTAPLAATTYEDLAACIAPSIFGHLDVKKGLLLMLFGGVSKWTSTDGLPLRGDVNACLVGDPSVAKSQFLKFVTATIPKAIYTSGKASSAAGLTASVIKDSSTGEFNIEAGALMLADTGICCIDEFDKMDLTDQVAIHEAMEQQTISIAKAGIHASLRARCSILAAANPVGGRYDTRRSIRENINMSPAILSRFDLLFVVRDHNDPVIDAQIARHIIGWHQRGAEAAVGRADEDGVALLHDHLLRGRAINPELSDGAKRQLVDEFCRLRREDHASGRLAWRITVRQLESMVRLSEALARVHLTDTVTADHVKEATRLIRSSIVYTGDA